jgi:serine protease Do
VNSESDNAVKGNLGMTVRPLTPDEIQKADGSKEGLVVERVDDGPAAQAGILPGDVILAVSGEKVDSADNLPSLVSKAGTRPAFHIIRGGIKMFVAIRVE